MSAAAEAVSSGKGHRDENFPVASWLIAPHHRPIILAFYRFVRAADDVADHASLPPEEKLALLDRLERSLLGRDDSEPAGVALRDALMLRRLPPRHALDLLSAFRLDVTKHRYADWDDLMDYCRLLGHAGRPLRPRRPWRVARRPGPPTMPFARRCR